MSHGGHGDNPYVPGARPTARRPATGRLDGEPESQRRRQDDARSRPAASAPAFDGDEHDNYGYDAHGQPLPSHWSASSQSSVVASERGLGNGYGSSGGAAAQNGNSSRRPSHHGHSRESPGGGNGDMTMGGQWSTPSSPEQARSARGSVSHPSNAALQRGRGRPSSGYFSSSSAHEAHGPAPSDDQHRR
ncbi:hypothetical protein JCM9279_005232 [Rhodotorula babjevae]